MKMNLFTLATLLATIGAAYDWFDLWFDPNAETQNFSGLFEVSEHITRIDFTKGPYGNIFRFKVYNNGVAQDYAPFDDDGCNSD